MTSLHGSMLRRATSLLSLRWMLTQLGLILLTFVLFAAWLRVPDASIFDVSASVVLAIVIFVVALAGEASLLLRLRALSLNPVDLLRGALVLFSMVMVWIVWGVLVSHLSRHDSLRAAYLNSQFPQGLRNFSSFEHLLRWSGWMWSTLQWIGRGVLLALALSVMAGTRIMQSFSAVVRCITYWIALFTGAALSTLVTQRLLHWTPGHGLRIETLSLVLRLAFVILFDLGVACFIVAILTACLIGFDEHYATPEGTPEASHPLTADNP